MVFFNRFAALVIRELFSFFYQINIVRIHEQLLHPKALHATWHSNAGVLDKFIDELIKDYLAFLSK